MASNKTNQYNLQRQISSLIPIVELCLPLAEKVARTQQKLEILPNNLARLRKEAELLGNNVSSVNSVNSNPLPNSRSPSKETELELDLIVDNIDEILVYLSQLKYQIDDLVVLRERLEALQEERLESVTPEHIEKLLVKKQLQAANSLENEFSRTNKPIQKLWQKLAGNQRVGELIKTSAIATGIILCFTTFAYSSMRHELVEHNVETETTLPNSGVEDN